MRIVGKDIDRSRRFLVVDDQSTMRRIVKSMLVEMGYTHVDEADDGATALPMLRSGSFDFLVTDWNMPTMPGLDLLKAVRAESATAHLPVIMLTTEASQQHIMEAAQAGVNAYVIKPFSAAILTERIDKVLRTLKTAPAQPA